MREILFRGKRIDNGEWVCSGNLIHFNEENECYIPVKNSNCTCTHDINDNIIEWNEVMFCKVIPETVGQYTGLTDKNGKRIFEGDIVMFLDYTEPAFVVWDQEDARWYMHYSDCMLDFSYRCVPSAIEVIGNIHDNPELIAEV